MKVKIADVLSTLVVIVYIHIGVIVTREDQQSVPFVNCSFKDGMCDWESISACWKIGQGSPTTSGTGSARDHTLRKESGMYIYLDTKSVNTSQSQVIQSPLPWNDSCLSLWYHICGNGTCKQTVCIETRETAMTTKFSTTQSGNRALLLNEEGELEDKWHSGEITIQIEEAFRILLVATTKRQSRTMAVDDTRHSKCCCKDNCGFDDGFCNMIERASDCFRWIRTHGSSFPRTNDPHSSRTKKTTNPQSSRTTKKTTTVQSGRSNKTINPQSHRTTKKTTLQSGHTNKTIDPQSRRTNKTVGVITVSLVGAVMIVVLGFLVGVWICRRKRSSKQRNTETANLQLPSYETLQHGIHIEDYLHVVYNPSHGITESHVIPLPHNITSNNDNEYDYVS